MPIERQSEQWPHRREAMLRAAIPFNKEDADFYQHRPKGPVPFGDYKTNPLGPVVGGSAYNFPATGFNPPSGLKGRPRLTWERDEPEQDTLPMDFPTETSISSGLSPDHPNYREPETLPYDRKPITLYRGLAVDLAHPGAAPIRRTLFGSEWEDTFGHYGHPPLPGMPSTEELADHWNAYDYQNPGLGPMLLDHLSNHYSHHSLGQHWSIYPNIGQEFGADGNGRMGLPLNVVLSGQWRGAGEDPYRRATMGNWPHEGEITLLPDAPLNVTGVHIQHPQTQKWHNVLAEPSERTAALDPERLHPMVRDEYAQWRSQLPPELAAHYDNGPAAQEEHDFTAQNYVRRSPWQNMENRSVYVGPEGFHTPRYPDLDSRPRLPGRDFRFHFAPDEVNPPAQTGSRPEPDWRDEQLDQDTLPGVDWPRGRHAPLYRGVNVDLRYEPELARALSQNHPELGSRLLEHLNGLGGMGTHWSTDPAVAQEYAGSPGEHYLPVMMTTRWHGAGEDPYRHESYGEFPEAKEITLLPGASTPITNLAIQHPETGQWHSLLDAPGQQRQASLDDEDEEADEDEEEFDGSYCQKCGEGDSDWCEDCGTCGYCDPDHQAHCPSCGPNDSDWCEDCGECKVCDNHEDHCPSCGPNDYDWCSECGQCKNCDWHDPHCENCGAGDSDWCESCEVCKHCDGGCYCEPDANPSSLKTPLHDHRSRPEFYDDSIGRDVHHFSPHEINPASEAQSRPYLHWERHDPDELDPALDFEVPPVHNGRELLHVDRKFNKLWRGLKVNLRNPAMAPLRRAIYGPQHESYYDGTPSAHNLWKPYYERKHDAVQPGMFPGIFSDKELAAGPDDPDNLHRFLPLLLNHFENYSKEHGLGRHWTTDEGTANSFAEQYSGGLSKFSPHYNNLHLPVRMTGHWMGHGEDPYRRETHEDHAGEYEGEYEMTMIPGTQMPLHNVEIYHPVTKQWHSLMDTPETRIARRR